MNLQCIVVFPQVFKLECNFTCKHFNLRQCIKSIYEKFKILGIFTVMKRSKKIWVLQTCPSEENLVPEIQEKIGGEIRD
uniref:Uncharacterized protein n=1 Tax=Arundo donax TaxID=35708 RepID=A0A0A9B7R5_ARUDO